MRHRGAMNRRETSVIKARPPRFTPLCPQIPDSRCRPLSHNRVPVPKLESEKFRLRRSPAGRTDSTSGVPFGRSTLGDRSLLRRAGPVRQLAASHVIDPPAEPAGSVCTCEQLPGTSARYACLEEHDHECKPSPHRYPSASTSGEKAGQVARADCGNTGNRAGCTRSKGAANLFTIPLDDERETASSGGLVP